MKKLHFFILKSYLGPLAATFFISIFILLLQILWRYIDILVGKGLDTFTLSELLLYSLLQVIPMALPLAILLASLMTFGSMGENYELTAIKASGISLLKAMKPLILITGLISFMAFFFSDNVMPWANLKFHTLLYSIKTHQPELEIKEGVFNKLDLYSIKVDQKDKQSGMLYGVMIYDHSNINNPTSNTTVAETGSLKMDEESQMMRLTLHNGSQYEGNVKGQTTELSLHDQQQFRHDVFKKQISQFNIQNQEFTRIDESGYANHNKMKNLTQLTNDIKEFKKKQSLITNQITLDHKLRPQQNPSQDYSSEQINSSLNTLSNNNQLLGIKSAKRYVQNKLVSLTQEIKKLEKTRSDQLKHQIELHRKFTLPFTCFIFFFIGSSIGAIIRKGGLGMPVVLAIAFFIVYYLLDTFGANMALKGVFPVAVGMWLSSAVLLLISIFLTYQSVRDSSLLNIDDLKALVNRLLNRESFNLQNSLDK